MRNSLAIPFLTLIVGLVAGGAGIWFWKTPETSKGLLPATGATSTSGDIVCTGRIDSLRPIIPLYPKLPGTVKSVQADESLMVTKGTVLMEIDPTPYMRKAALAKANAEMAKAALDEAESEKAKFAYAIEQARLGLKSAEIELEQAQKELKQIKEKKAETNPSNGYVPTDELIDQVELKVKLLQLKLEYSQQQQESIRKTDIESKVNQAKAARDAANVQKQEADDAVADCRLVAPVDGSVLRVMISPGAQVSPGSPLVPMMFAPAGPLVVRAEVDQEFLGRVNAGYAVTFRDETQPNAPTWDGTVLNVSRWVARQRSILFDPLEVNDVRTAEVVIEVKSGSASGQLLLGQRVRVRIKPLTIQ